MSGATFGKAEFHRVLAIAVGVVENTLAVDSGAVTICQCTRSVSRPTCIKLVDFYGFVLRVAASGVEGDREASLIANGRHQLTRAIIIGSDGAAAKANQYGTKRIMSSFLFSLVYTLP